MSQQQQQLQKRLGAIGIFGKRDVCFCNSKTLRTVKTDCESVLRRYQATGTVSDLPRTWSPRKTTRQQDCSITLTHMRNFRCQPATVTAGTILRLRRICSGTIRNRLREKRVCTQDDLLLALFFSIITVTLLCLGQTAPQRFRNAQ